MNSVQLAVGFMLAVGIGGLAYWRRSLTASGWLGAAIVGTLTFGLGGFTCGIVLIAFFLSSSLLSHYKERQKEARAAEKFAKGGRRDFAQTMANGGLAALLAGAYGLFGQPPLLFAAFIGVMATVTADTWATELGVLSTQPPRLITSGRIVEPGTSGGVSAVGTTAAAAGACFIGLIALVSLLFEQQIGGGFATLSWWIIPGALLGGLGGALFDSLLGANWQAIYSYADGRETERPYSRNGSRNSYRRGWRWLNNDLVNFISSVVGAVLAVLVLLPFR
ncbi:DUF92 domain-containing protein [Candidatus Gracilibacteria bacterium]|nr:DUF92 domain-containing protein [Candidatus Gracilibacteria bacterium]